MREGRDLAGEGMFPTAAASVFLDAYALFQQRGLPLTVFAGRARNLSNPEAAAASGLRASTSAARLALDQAL